MNIFKFVILSIIIVYLFHKISLWMEKKGWIYYRNKPTGTGYGNALQELNKIMNPSIKNVRELQEEQKNNQKDKDKDKDLIEFK